MPTVAPPNASRSEIWGESEAMAPQALPNLALSAAAWVSSCWTVGATAQERPWAAEARLAAGVARKRHMPQAGDQCCFRAEQRSSVASSSPQDGGGAAWPRWRDTAACRSTRQSCWGLRTSAGALLLGSHTAVRRQARGGSTVVTPSRLPVGVIERARARGASTGSPKRFGPPCCAGCDRCWGREGLACVDGAVGGWLGGRGAWALGPNCSIFCALCLRSSFVQRLVRFKPCDSETELRLLRRCRRDASRCSRRSGA